MIFSITDSLKLLGVTIDSKLNFSEHINMICKIAGQKIGVLMRLRNLIPTNATLMFFKTAILPHLTYCHLVWHFCRASDSRKIERMQERGLCAVFRNNVSYPKLLKRAELPGLQNRRLQDFVSEGHTLDLIITRKVDGYFSVHGSVVCRILAKVTATTARTVTHRKLRSFRLDSLKKFAC